MAILVNGEVVQLSEPADETVFEITGANPEYRLTETDQADPAGRFRWRIEGDQLLIQRAGSAAWATATTIVTLDGPSASVVSPVLTTPQINDTSADHQYVFAVSELTADRTVTLPLLGAGDTFVFESHAQTLTSKTLTSPIIGTQITLDQATEDYTLTWDDPAAPRAISIPDPLGTDVFVFRDMAQTLLAKTLTSPVLTTPQINDTSSDHQYIFAVSELAADRTVTLPLLAANDTWMFLAHHQADQAALEAETNEDTYVPPDLVKNSPGVAKGWCRVDSTGALVSGSYNVASITDTDTGNRTIVWATDFASADYALFHHVVGGVFNFILTDTFAVGSVRFNIYDTDESTKEDRNTSSVAFGDQ